MKKTDYARKQNKVKYSKPSEKVENVNIQIALVTAS